MARSKKNLAKRERVLAKYAALRLLAGMAEDVEVIAAISKEFGCCASAAKAVVAEAWSEIMSADDGVDVQQKKGLMVMASREHYRRCMEKGDTAQGTASLRLLARIWGLEKQPETNPLDEPKKKGEYDGRSPEELRHYAKHGSWPEEQRPVKKAPEAPRDPLAGLHH